MRASEIASEELVLFLLPLGTPPVIIGTDEVSPSSSSKHDVHENEVDKVFHELRSKHADDYTGPQYRIWSRMIVNKIHENLEEPPNIFFCLPPTAGYASPLTSFTQMHQRVMYPPFCSCHT